MATEVLIEDERWAAAELPALATRASDAALRGAGLTPEAWEISVLACDDARIATLNTEFRGKPTPTNVLSWPSAERGAPPDTGADPELGDIAISYDTCAREAAAAGLNLDMHVLHLLVHGTLHLLGYDHETDADAAVMEGLETQILATLGVADPY
ncbi:MAG: rRNA maturation RNase YbeY [Pseudomonadota bacterium]